MEISDEYQDMGNPGGGVAMASIPLHHRQSPASSESHQEEESDPEQDEESGEELPQQPLHNNTHTSNDDTSVSAGLPVPLTSHINNFLAPHQHFMKLKQEPADMDMIGAKSNLDALHAVMANGYGGFPFQTPAFLQLQHLNPAQNRDAAGVGNNALPSSASSHSSESSQSSSRNNNDPRDNGSQSNPNNNNSGNSSQQQSSWSFEEQFKQVRQLYEINDDPKRKEFLDDLFSYMQKRGTPINRLPIMAKSVLDLYELYNLVIARGGLVDVINKKLWQEIIKGLHLPSSITSAAFTLRTQYMKYLYPYECEKLRLSTPAELQAAIDGNRREGRRSSYGAYSGGSGDNMLPRTPSTPGSLALHTQMSPLSLVTALGGQHHSAQSMANDYLKLLQRDFQRSMGSSSPPLIHKQGSPPGSPPRDTNQALAEMSRLTLWNMYNNNPLYGGLAQPPLSPQTSHSPHPQAASPEPQREALDLGLRTSPTSSSPIRHSSPSSGGSLQVKKDRESLDTPSLMTSQKRSLSDDEGPHEKMTALPGTHIKISNRGDGRNGDNSLAVSMEINGMMYQGVLYAQSDNNNKTSISISNNNNNKTRSLVS
ncbi:AT-rich interactive domain-containing protein 3C isoform X7 [Microplitis mediator]|uniref:AT-rich interactive domain-containing protein 3C isoform X7 n=1 Tax=Microplitis mediator TaxID=375433 RepID=UPI002556B2B7|nr:AT-rich interactive domain-containing protein 3C isoform X7 [Microplitis mediator]